jgi:hypothetical protein
MTMLGGLAIETPFYPRRAGFFIVNEEIAKDFNGGF